MTEEEAAGIACPHQLCPRDPEARRQL